MKTKEQIEASLRRVGIKAADLVSDVACKKSRGEDVSRFDCHIGQALAAVDCLRWVLGDDPRDLRDYLLDKTRGQDLFDFLDRFSVENRQ